MSQYVAVLRDSDQLAPHIWGPFDSEKEARRFAAFASDEVDPTIVVQLHSPLTELLNWRNAGASL